MHVALTPAVTVWMQTLWLAPLISAQHVSRLSQSLLVEALVDEPHACTRAQESASAATAAGEVRMAIV
jgi:hypothetical protein